MTINSLSNSISAIKAFGTKMASAAENIANAQSKGYKKSRVTLEEKENNLGVKASVSRPDTPGVIDDTGEEISNVDIAEEFVNTLYTQHGLEANIKAIRTMDEMSGTIINIKE